MFLLLGTLCKFMTHAIIIIIIKKQKNFWLPIPLGCFLLLFLTEELNKPQFSGTPAAWSPSNKRATFRMSRMMWFTSHHKSVMSSLTQCFPRWEVLQDAKHWVLGRHSKKFPFYKPTPPFLARHKQEKDSALCLVTLDTDALVMADSRTYFNFPLMAPLSGHPNSF